MIPTINTAIKVSSNDIIERSFDAILDKAPKEWLSPSIHYKRWTATRRHYYYSPRYKAVPLEEYEIRNVVRYLNPDNLSKLTETSLEQAKKIPAVKKLLTTMQLNFVNEFLRVSKNLLEDKEKIAANKEAKIEKKRLAQIRTEKTKEANRKKKMEDAVIRKAKLDEIKQKNRQIALRKALREEKIASKNKELLASLCLTAEQKAILKKIAG
jgi:hypothetical protein